MRTHPTFQRNPLVRLRRESWGGIAFHRGEGDLLELDESGFAVLTALSEAQSLPILGRSLRSQNLAVRLPKLARFLRTLEDRGFLEQVRPGTPALPPDFLAKAYRDE